MPPDPSEQRPSPAGPPPPRAAGMAGQLRWVHDMLRRDLVTVQDLAAAVVDGASPGSVQAGLRALQSQGPLFQLRVNCLSYCQTLHAHHHTEDVALFPAARRSAPHLTATIDRLEADHRVVSGLLDQVEEHARGLDDRAVRRALVEALTDLSTTLLEHLELEEATLGPVLDTWSEWPERAPAEIREHARRFS
jgi:iron-sulfur cluster repair protein YtfE (RIC family)